MGMRIGKVVDVIVKRPYEYFRNLTGGNSEQNQEQHEMLKRSFEPYHIKYLNYIDNSNTDKGIVESLSYGPDCRITKKNASAKRS